MVAASVIRLIEHDPVMRLDADPEGVHQARVSTRRIRSDLRTFTSLVDPVWASALRDELGWLAGILGSVRDSDVMLARMQARAAKLPKTTAPGVARVLATLEGARDQAHAELLATLRSERYLALLDRLVAASNALSLLLEADRPAAEILPDLVRRPWRALEKRVRDLGETPTDQALHGVRIRTKRVRYAAEAVAPLMDRRAHMFATAAAGLQRVLGDLNDAAVAEGWLRNWTRGTRSIQGAFAAGELAESGPKRSNIERAGGRRGRSCPHPNSARGCD
jgi:CHAD domain-containing protein